MTTNIAKKIISIIQITGKFLKQWMQDKIYEKPEMCSVIEPMHEAIGRCGVKPSGYSYNIKGGR